MYQFMKELFPAEWLPTTRTETFFRGGRILRPTTGCDAMPSRPRPPADCLPSAAAGRPDS
jgi:hypothetical protein